MRAGNTEGPRLRSEESSDRTRKEARFLASVVLGTGGPASVTLFGFNSSVVFSDRAWSRRGRSKEGQP